MHRMMVAGLALSLAGCASQPLNHALGTPKNPTAILSDPYTTKRDDQLLFIKADYGVLLEAVDTGATPIKMKAVDDDFDMRRYLGAGYHLADTYCAQYFSKTDEAYRRRRFGRTLTNDVGTAVTTLLGLANAGEGAVTALAATTGLADSAWRNYDDSFVISPELATVRGLVLAAQDNFRARTLGKESVLPGDYGTAQSTIQRYAELCSHLGMKSLLEQSATKQQTTLKDETEKLNKPKEQKAPVVLPAPVARPAPPVNVAPVIIVQPLDDRPATATPALTPNTANE